MDSVKLPNGWRMSAPYSEEKNAAYRLRMTEEQIKAGHLPPKALPAFNSEEEKAEYIFKQQPKSTQEALLRQKSRPKEDDLEWLLRPIPQEYLANPDAQTLDQLANMRPLKPDEIMVHKGAPRAFSLGESKQSSVGEEKRDRGIHAFTYSKPANPTVEDLKRLKKAEPIEAVSPEFALHEEEPKETLSFKVSSFLHKLTGVWWW